ncbi:MAG: septum site-determining protein MinD [Clostridia bacterium]|nr:septum site-determining protein MinD [Clostridia bacterium]
MGDVIVVTSGKGGVGKTTSTVNIAAALASIGKSVVMLDADVGLRNLDVVIGLENKIVYDFLDVIEGRCRLRQAIVSDKRFDGKLSMLAASQTRNKTDVSEEQMKKLCDELAEKYDYVLIDCPAGIEQGFFNAVAGANRAIVVTTPEFSSIRDADRILGKLEEKNIPKIQILLNNVRTSLIQSGDMPGVDEVIELLAADLLGVIPHDINILISANKGEILTAKNSSTPAALAYKNVAKRITGETVPLLDLANDGSFKYKLKRLFKRKNKNKNSGIRRPQSEERLTDRRNNS